MDNGNNLRSLDTPEKHVEWVKSLVKILDSGTWVADLITDLAGQCELNGLGKCTPQWVEARLASSRKQFERDVELARKMLRYYPDLVLESPAQEPVVAATAEPEAAGASGNGQPVSIESAQS